MQLFIDTFGHFVNWERKFELCMVQLHIHALINASPTFNLEKNYLLLSFIFACHVVIFVM